VVATDGGYASRGRRGKAGMPDYDSALVSKKGEVQLHASLDGKEVRFRTSDILEVEDLQGSVRLRYHTGVGSGSVIRIAMGIDVFKRAFLEDFGRIPWETLSR
jgi:hypothetical protein